MSRRSTFRLLSGATLLMVTALVITVTAEERHLDFVHKLQERGYGDVAIQYLERLNRSESLPDEVRDVWELELGKSLRISADDAANLDQDQKRLADALVHIDRFLKDNPDHPAAAQALESLGDIATQRGQLLIKQARATTDKAKQAEHFTSARAALEEARP